jgi:hypothetical protein
MNNVVEAEAVSQVAGNRRPEVRHWRIRRESTTGIGEAGEFGKISDGTWEDPISLHLENEAEY